MNCKLTALRLANRVDGFGRRRRRRRRHLKKCRHCSATMPTTPSYSLKASGSEIRLCCGGVAGPKAAGHGPRAGGSALRRVAMAGTRTQGCCGATAWGGRGPRARLGPWASMKPILKPGFDGRPQPAPGPQARARPGIRLTAWDAVELMLPGCWLHLSILRLGH